MNERQRSNSPPQEAYTHIDPIAFEDLTVFGLDPAIHWVQFNNQCEQFPEIVGEIVLHWSDRPWLVKLLKRLGYNPDLYHPTQNPHGVFEVVPPKDALTPIRLFLLRAAGVKAELLHGMFRLAPDRRTWRLSLASMEGIIAARSQTARGENSQQKGRQ